MQGHSAMNVSALIKCATEGATGDYDQRKKAVRFVAKKIGINMKENRICMIRYAIRQLLIWILKFMAPDLIIEVDVKTLKSSSKRKMCNRVYRFFLAECLSHHRVRQQGTFARLIQWLSRMFPCAIFSNELGNYLLAIYFITKMLYVFNLGAQLYLIGLFTGL